MPLTEKGDKIKSAMQEKYGKERGEQVFYASKNKGTISGVDGMAKAKDQGEAPPTTSMGGGGMQSSGIGATAGMTSSTGTSTPTTMDEGDWSTNDELEVPERRDELVGDIPEEEAKEPKDRSNLPDTVKPETRMSRTLTSVTTPPLSIPVGDQSLGNMNSRNRSFWKR